MTTDREVLYTRREAAGLPWAEITLNRPEKGNALTLAMLDQLDEYLSQIEQDRQLRAVVLRGNGRFFCTGGDISAWGSMTPAEMEAEWIPRGIGVLMRLAALPQTVIAAIHGHAIGGGLELALAADLRIAVRGAKLGVPEVALGIISGWTGVRKLAETIGVARARHMLLLGTSIAAEQALDWGLVTALADDTSDLERQLEGWLATLRASAPISIELSKQILASMHADFATEHARAAAHACGTADCREGVRAFREKRKPVFTGE